ARPDDIEAYPNRVRGSSIPMRALSERTPKPQQEREEPQVRRTRLRDFSFADWKAILVRSVKELMDDNGTLLASALAYSTFFAIPATLLVVVGLFSLTTGPGTIDTLMAH